MYLLRDSLFFVFFVESVGHSHLILACDITSRADTSCQQERTQIICLHAF